MYSNQSVQLKMKLFNYVEIIRNYTVCGKMCRVRLYTELFYAIVPTLFPDFLLIYMLSIHFLLLYGTYVSMTL